MGKPLVSIVMSVYNGEKYVEEALDSILAQTFSGWEAIIIDDSSSDRTPKILRRYAQRDGRISVYTNQGNLGLAASLNRGIAAAAGTYIVRMDGDDICRRDRIERQVSFMEAHPEVDVASCKFFALQGKKAAAQLIGRKGDPASVQALFLFFNPLLHPGVIARAETMKKILYSPEFSRTEDLHLWTRMLIQKKQAAVQDDYLMLYRIHDSQVTVQFTVEQKEQYKKLIVPFYRKMVFPMSEGELQVLTEGIYCRERALLKEAQRFFARVIEENKKKRNFSAPAVRYAVFEAYKGFRHAGVSRGKLLLQLVRLTGLAFSVGELLDRRRRIKKDTASFMEAAALFELTPAGREGNMIIFEKKGREN